MIHIQAFVSRVRTEHEPVYQTCPTIQEEMWKNVFVSSDQPQSPCFYVSNQSFHLLSFSLFFEVRNVHVK